jgi:hypothetical protein
MMWSKQVLGHVEVCWKMRKMRTFFFLAAAVASVIALSQVAALAQDEQSLGDAARQARLQKQQKDAQAKDTSNPDAGKDSSANDPAKNHPARKDPFTKTTQPTSTVKKTQRVITNEEIPEHVGPAARPVAFSATSHAASDDQSGASDSDGQAAALRSQITSMKENVASLQSQIDSVNDSIRFAPGNCVSGCVQWNERQVQKQQQVEQMKAQLEELKKQLEDTQESARKQGFGSSVYDP